MSQYFDVCVSYKLGLTTKKIVLLIDVIIGIFNEYFKDDIEVSMVNLLDYSETLALDIKFLVDFVGEIQKDSKNILFIYGVSSFGNKNSISISYTNYDMEIVISISSKEIIMINKDKLLNTLLEVWNSTMSFDIFILASGYELEFDNCSIVEQLDLFLDSLSLACWIIVSEDLIVESEHDSYELTLQDKYKVFTSKYIEQRLITK